MTFYEKESAEQLKLQILSEQNYSCAVCGKTFSCTNLPELAHRIPKHKWILKKYGGKVVHHKLNLKATCSKCNSAVLVDPHKIEGKELLDKIINALEET